jgi:hypothetical protein
MVRRQRNDKAKVGGIAFIVGLVVAAIIAVFSAALVPVWAVWVIAVLGLIVGLLNISDEEVVTFLLASIAFLISFQSLSAIVSTLTFGWTAVATFFNLMSVFIAPAVAVVAVKALFVTTKS